MGMQAIIVVFIILGCAIWEGHAAEAKFPTRPIQIIIGFQPGSTDIALRPFTEKLPEYLGQPISFVYKPGATGAVGASFVARAKPDGYTLMGTTQAAVVIIPLTMESDYKLDDFTPICRLVRTSIILAVKADSRWKTLKDIVEEAKKSPGKLTYSSAGIFGNNHLAMEMFLKSIGVDITHVPCAGSTPAVTALLGGHVDMTSSTMGPISPHLKAGAVRPIAFFEKERLKEYPNIPTFAELGYPVIYPVWYGLFAPKGTPEEVVKTIYKGLEKVVENHKNFIEDRLEKVSLNLDVVNPEEFAKEVKVLNESLKKILKDLKQPTK